MYFCLSSKGGIDELIWFSPQEVHTSLETRKIKKERHSSILYSCDKNFYLEMLIVYTHRPQMKQHRV